MANTIYVPVGGLSDEVEKFYASVGGLSKEVIKGYCSVGGLSKQFYGSGGDSLIFEYDYQNNTIYSIHNYLTLDYILTICYNEFVRRYGSYSSQYSELVYLMNNWQTIKSAIITAVGNIGYNIQNIRVALRHEISASVPRVDIAVWYGDDTFPKNVKTDSSCRKTDTFGNVYYGLTSAIEAPSTPPPQGDYWLNTSVFSSYYSVDTNPRTASVSMLYIGLYDLISSARRETYMSNFGMKIQTT